MDGNVATAIAQEFTVTNMGLLLLILSTWAAQYFHSRDCQKRRKGFHDFDNDLSDRMTGIERDVHWIKETLQEIKGKL